MTAPRHARHARPPESRRAGGVDRVEAPQGGGRHRAPRHRAQRRPAVRPAIVGVAVLAVGASGTFGVRALAADEAAQVASAVAVQSPAEAAAEDAVRATAERASRTEERAKIKAARERAREKLTQIRAREARLERERQARVARQMCARAEDVLAGLGLGAAQQRNVAIIVDMARRLGLPPRAAVVAVAAAWQESRLQNLEYGLADSIGMFQQRPSMGWGSNAQLQDPYYSTGKFYERLVEIRGWKQMGVGEAAQAVQASAYPRAYDRWVDDARDTVRAIETLRRAHVRC